MWHFMIRKSFWKFLGLLLLPILVIGCGGSDTRISGTVSYDGEPISKGQIVFMPADGKGTPEGGEIVDGKYTVKAISPGKKIVQISAAKESAAPVHNLEDMVGKGKNTTKISTAPVIPAHAEGNNATIEILPGNNTQNFDMKKPTKPAGKAR